MEILVLAGAVVTVIGLIGLVYCILKAFNARKSGLEGDELTAHLKSLVAINIAAFFISALGLCMVVVGILL